MIIWRYRNDKQKGKEDENGGQNRGSKPFGMRRSHVFDLKIKLYPKLSYSYPLLFGNKTFIMGQ